MREKGISGLTAEDLIKAWELLKLKAGPGIFYGTRMTWEELVGEERPRTVPPEAGRVDSDTGGAAAAGESP